MIQHREANRFGNVGTTKQVFFIKVRNKISFYKAGNNYKNMKNVQIQKIKKYLNSEKLCFMIEKYEHPERKPDDK